MNIEQAAILGYHFAGVSAGAIEKQTGFERKIVLETIERAEKQILPFKRVAMLTQACPYHDSCRDCTFSSCRMNAKMTVAMV